MVGWGRKRRPPTSVCVFTSVTAVESHLMREALRAAGIESELRNEHIGSVQPLFGANDLQPQLWVATADADRAREVIADVQSAPDETVELGHCRSCGEAEESGYSACWKCGAPYPMRLDEI